MSEIARRAGVQRPAVTNWRRRHADFPGAQDSAEQLFDAGEVARWLDLRRISSRARRPGEDPGITFGDRFRRTFENEAAGRSPRLPFGDPDVREAGAEGDRPDGENEDWNRRAHRFAGLLLDRLHRLRGIGDPSAYADLFLIMIYLRASDQPNWSRFVALARAHAEVPLSTHLRTALDRHASERPELAALLSGFPRLPSPDGPAVPELPVIELLDAWDDPRVTDKARPPADFAVRVYEEMLEQIAISEGYRGGEFYTPRSVVGLVAATAAPNAGDRLHDPCCGTGGMLAGAAALLRDDPSPSVSGRALSPRPGLLAGINLALHGIPPHVTTDAAEKLRGASSTGDTFDLIITNPPFGTKHWTDRVSEDDPRWTYGVPPASNANFAWLQHIASLLRDSGRAVVVMPPNSTFSTRVAERRIRAGMIEDGLVECVMALPPGLFRNTGIAVTVWVLRKDRSPGDNVLLIDAHHVGEQSLDQIADTYRRSRAGGPTEDATVPARWFTVEELRAADYSLNPLELLAPDKARLDHRAAVEQLARSAVRLTDLTERSRRIDADVTAQVEELLAARAARRPSGSPPGGWRRARLEELCKVQIGPAGVPSTDDTTGVPVITARQIRDRRIRSDDLGHAPAAFAKSASQYRVRPGDIVSVRTGVVSRTALVEEAQAGWLLGRGCLLLRPGGGILPSYLLHYLAHPRAVEWVLRSATSSVLPTINVRRLRELPVMVPPKAEQEEIVALLDALDEKAAVHTEIARTTQGMHASALHTLLVDIKAEHDVTP
ncbi:N-6 DNA methylase [Actinomadura rubrisoli]|uniref:site-specific DNA-methyltransferase (adenine-specific) n=1 Tax=Actinomadura rubrisoli TaxID=2530368 RepID=A0A4R5A4P5_9ACTN|nr:N-6 DNA methylase [Actinomadura rubrisoli]TDD66968.1 hypothetical protein E1298_39810 [Actinomadura rubrisoli]